MLLWSTEFAASEGATAGDVLQIARKWLIGSPHHSWDDQSLTESAGERRLDLDVDGQQLSQVQVGRGAERWTGFRLVWADDDGLEWRIEIVGWEIDSRLQVSVRVHCQVPAVGSKPPEAKKPYVVRQLLDELGGGADGDLTISEGPVILSEQDVGKAGDLISGHAGNRLPIVYASADRNGEPAIDCTRLAQWLAGMAHVVVEPSRHFSFALSCHLDQTAPYGGATSVFWPGGEGGQVRLLPSRFSTAHKHQRALASIVREGLAYAPLSPECTWDHLEHIVNEMVLAELKESGSENLDEWVAVFQPELNAKIKRIDELTADNHRLKSRLAALAESSGGTTDGLLACEDEVSLYPGELEDALLFALEHGRNSLYEGGRRRDIVDAVLGCNHSAGHAAAFDAEIHSLLDSYTSFGSRERSGLESLGFTITDDGKHVKAVFRGDARYTFTLAKTPSDHRAGKNTAAEILRRLLR